MPRKDRNLPSITLAKIVLDEERSWLLPLLRIYHVNPVDFVILDFQLL